MVLFLEGEETDKHNYAASSTSLHSPITSFPFPAKLPLPLLLTTCFWSLSCRWIMIPLLHIISICTSCRWNPYFRSTDQMVFSRKSSPITKQPHRPHLWTPIKSTSPASADRDAIPWAVRVHRRHLDSPDLCRQASPATSLQYGNGLSGMHTLVSITPHFIEMHAVVHTLQNYHDNLCYVTCSIWGTALWDDCGFSVQHVQ